jgi:hypothetical protein
MNYTSVADKWEQRRLRHKHQHPPLLNVNQVLVETLTRASGSLTGLRLLWVVVHS